MKTLVDTSVWSLALRKKGPTNDRTVGILAALLNGNEDIVLIGIILQEILQAFRSDSTVKRVAQYLAPVPLLPLDRSDFVNAATLHRKCASKGIAASTVDCLIATAAINHQCVLLTADKDFARIAQHCKLKLA